MGFIRNELTNKSKKQGMTRDSFLCEAVREMQSVMLHSVLGPLGVYFAFMSATNLDAIRDTIVAHPASTVEQCTIFSYASIIGSVFGS